MLASGLTSLGSSHRELPVAWSVPLLWWVLQQAWGSRLAQPGCDWSHQCKGISGASVHCSHCNLDRSFDDSNPRK